MKLARVFGVAGRILLSAGTLTLLFVAYQLWGTGIHEARAQGSLSSEFDEVLDTAPSAPIGPPDAEDPIPPPPDVDAGEAVARIEIPALDVDKIVVEGVEVDDLKRGPGRFPGTSHPGQEGNAAIAGHRTTYGAPFYSLEQLEDGDEIIVTTVQGEFRYEFREQLIVSPSQTEILDDYGDNRLTLVACHPRYSAAQRIVAVAELAEGQEPLPASDSPLHRLDELAGEDPTGSEGDEDAAGPEGLPGEEGLADGEAPTGEGPDEDATDEVAAETGLGYNDLDGDTDLGLDDEAVWPAVLLALACALIWAAAWLASRMVKPVAAYAVGAPLFLLCLFYFFEEFSRFLPANF